jgi:nicotinate-nucleotide adenylyltransferase
MEKKIVLFGLNADPPHLGHLQVVYEVEKQLGPETLFVVMPTGNHPLDKPQVASNTHRLAMTQLLFMGSKRVMVDDFELNKVTKSYTLDSLIHLKTKYPHSQLYFIIATDVANNFFSWHEPIKILSIADPIVVSRVGFELNPEVKEEFYKKSHPVILETHSLPISSSEIRQKRVLEHLSSEVKKYVEDHNLY